MDTVLAVLPWILPPILGAIIGYVTNRIAIKMLFRPLTAKHVLGIRVPLTPGVIPRNRSTCTHHPDRCRSQLLSPQALRNMNLRSFGKSLKRRRSVKRRRALLERSHLAGPGKLRDGAGPGESKDSERTFLPRGICWRMLGAFLK